METPTTTRSSGSAGEVAPRVVIFEENTGARVEVLELPSTTHLGAVFHHSGHTWRITATRSHSRVLFAEPT